jgi:hypothetical protein
MRAFSASGLLALPAFLFAAGLAPLAAQESGREAGHEHGDQAHKDDPDRAVAGGGSVPAGWTVRTDGNAGNANVKVIPMDPGMHVTLGPAIILYPDKHAGNGPFHPLATFTQTKPSTHPEGYGLFFGGQALTGAGQKYTYFLIRQDGKYLVKRRDGDKTTDVTKGWVESAAVKKSAGQGSAANLLEIDAKQNPSKVVFKVNGESVYSMDAKPADLKGTVGLRVNHNLDVHIEGFDVHR